jgi:hypothetical protein
LIVYKFVYISSSEQSVVGQFELRQSLVGGAIDIPHPALRATFSLREMGNPLSLWERVSAEGGRVRAGRYGLTHYRTIVMLLVERR